MNSEPFWQKLFTSDGSSTSAVPMKLLKKRGEPFLLLPDRPDLAAHALDLYPAQTAQSRLARSLARWILKARLPLGAESIPVRISHDDAFVRWLSSLAQSENQIPPFAVLAGNPNSPGQRLILLLFDPTGQPTVVIKVGLTEHAQQLIKQERQFLEGVPRTFSAIPPVRGAYANERLQALALDFVPGRSPVAHDESSIPRILSQWIHSQDVLFANTRVGRELETVCSQNPVYKAQSQRLQSHRFRAAVYHGDFTPWNVRVSSDSKWTALDWERGELNGLPVWDWFHYVVQKNILVRHQSAESVAVLLESLLAQDDFKAYAQAGNVTGTERALLLLYLLHHTEVIRPSEGLQVTQDLLKLLESKWRAS